jgi:hypothetical protein
MRFKVRTLLLVPVVCAVGLVCARIPVARWSGAKPVLLTFLVVDRLSGSPITDATVELIHEYDDERVPVKGRTSSDGCLALRNLFSAFGTMYAIGRSENVTFYPWLVRVEAAGYRPYCAMLAKPLVEPVGTEADQPLNLAYPVTGPVKIALSRSAEAPKHEQ